MTAAIYSRYSTDKQSDGSAGTIAQQVAIATECAKRHGCKVTARYQDEGISGAAIGNRPGIQSAIAAAEAGEYEVLIVSDLSRLSRSQADLPRIIERMAFRGVRVLGAQDGFDSSREDSDLSAGLHGIIGQQFRRMIAARVRSALKMRAEAGHRAGGKPYGYRCVDSNGGRGLAIDPEQGPIVQTIFARYAAGDGSREIAMDLTARHIPSPGALWARTTRRKDGRWLNSGVYAMLGNEIYRGEFIWNRSKWTKDPDTGVRRRDERPRSEWIVQAVPELRLVSDELWAAVQSRIHARSQSFPPGKTSGNHRGRPARHLLSGLFECAECGYKLIVSGSRTGRYICSSHRNGGSHACGNALTAPLQRSEDLLLEHIKEQMLTPEAVKVYTNEYTKACKMIEQADQPARGAPPKATKLDAQIADLEQMLKEGRLSPAVAGAALEQARAERRALEAAFTGSEQRQKAKVVRMFPRAAEALRQQLDTLRETLSDPEVVQRARPIVHRLCGGKVLVRPDKSGKYLEAEINWNPAPLLLAAGAEPGVLDGSASTLRYLSAETVAPEE
jgi:site-specific DNA recombinase